MGRTATRRPATQRQRPPLRPTQNIELVPPTITEDNRISVPDAGTIPPTSSQVEPNQPAATEDDVRLRAYEIYLKRGDNPGDHVSDWLQAERELQAN